MMAALPTSKTFLGALYPAFARMALANFQKSFTGRLKCEVCA